MNPPDWGGALKKVLARYPAIARPCAEPEPLGNAGGLSGALLWRFSSGRGLLVARAWPPEGPPRIALETIHRWVASAGRVGFLAVPLAALDGRTVQEEEGRLWDVAAWLPGCVPVSEAPSRARVRAAFTALGAVHQALQGEGRLSTSPGLRERVREFEWWSATGFSALEIVLKRSETDAAGSLAKQWLDDAREVAPQWLGPLREAAGLSVWCQPCLRDVRPDHFLFTADQVTGLVDYGAMGIDSVAGDLARLMAEWLGPDRALRADGLAAYAAIRPLSESETVLIAPFETAAALLGAGRWAAWHFFEGRIFRDPDAVTQGLRKGLDRLAQRMASELA